MPVSAVGQGCGDLPGAGERYQSQLFSAVLLGETAVAGRLVQGGAQEPPFSAVSAPLPVPSVVEGW